uniref:BTB domain-containing protein n=1 Tax=Strigamia maritima TaxID=126957 RepID=T1J067_STRMM
MAATKTFQAFVVGGINHPWRNLRRSLCTTTNLYTSRQESQTGIIQLRCNDGCVLAHKCVLVAGSDYFRSMFSQHNVENETNMVTFQDISQEVMNIIIKFIYSQYLPTKDDITNTVLKDTLIVADKMQFKDLFAEYWQLYSTPITLENLLDVWKMAEMFTQDETIENIRKFVLVNMKQISSTCILSDMTVAQLENIIIHNIRELAPDKIGNFIIFLLAWGTNVKNIRKYKIPCVVYLISKCDIKKLPDYVLRELMSNKEVKKSPLVYELLNKHVTFRWMTITKPQLQFHSFENGTIYKHSVCFLNHADWMPITEEFKMDKCLAAVSETGALFYYSFSEYASCYSFVAYELPTGQSYWYDQIKEFPIDGNNITNETSNYGEIYFRRTQSSYFCFNLELKEWSTIEFNDLMKDCKSLLLAIDGKYFFDVDEKQMNIVDKNLGTCVTKEKFIHFLIYTIESDSWSKLIVASEKFLKRLNVLKNSQKDDLGSSIGALQDIEATSAPPHFRYRSLWAYPIKIKFPYDQQEKILTNGILKHIMAANQISKVEKNQRRSHIVSTSLYNSREPGHSGIVKLQCKDGSVLAHKCILQAASEYFRAMYSHRNIENETNVATYRDTSMEVMNIIIKFIYSQNLPTKDDITHTMLQEILITADKLQLKELFDEYWPLYSTPITVDTFLRIWPLAEMLNRDKTMGKIRIFVLDNLNQISKTDSLADITEAQLENIITHNIGGLSPDKICDFIIFLITWGTKGTHVKKSKLHCVVNLITRCNLGKLPDYNLRELMSNKEVNKSSKVLKFFNKQVISRWMTITKPRLQIHLFECLQGTICKHSVSYLNRTDWTPVTKELKMDKCFPAVSKTGTLFYYTFSESQILYSCVAYESPTGQSYRFNEIKEFSANGNIITNETSNYGEIFFRRTPSSYFCFNLELKKWRAIEFNDLMKDCKSLLLAVDGKYFLDVDEKKMKIVDKKLGTCVTKEKSAGKWQIFYFYELEAFLELENEIPLNVTETIYNLLSKEATSRWISITKPRLQIHAFEFLESNRYSHSVSYLNVNNEGWTTTTTKLIKDNFFPAVSLSGILFFYQLCETDKSKFVIYEYPAKLMTLYDLLEEHTLNSNYARSETANCKEIFFRWTNLSYVCFNTELKTLRLIDFKSFVDRVKCMLLATDGKYFFDVSEQHIKIVDTDLNTCMTKEKLPGNWQNVASKFLDNNNPTKLIFKFTTCNATADLVKKSDQCNGFKSLLGSFRALSFTAMHILIILTTQTTDYTDRQVDAIVETWFYAFHRWLKLFDLLLMIYLKKMPNEEHFTHSWTYLST